MRETRPGGQPPNEWRLIGKASGDKFIWAMNPPVFWNAIIDRENAAKLEFIFDMYATIDEDFVVGCISRCSRADFSLIGREIC